MTDTVRALENAEEQIEEFKAAITHPNLVVDTNMYMTRSLHHGTCPACGEWLTGVVAWDGVVKGYCANARKFVTIKV